MAKKAPHLSIQDGVIRAGREWVPPAGGWVFIRLSQGEAYWQPPQSEALPLDAGDLILAVGDLPGTLLASHDGPSCIHYFAIDAARVKAVRAEPRNLALESALSRPVAQVWHYSHRSEAAWRFAAIAATWRISPDKARTDCLQLWAEEMAKVLNTSRDRAWRTDTAIDLAHDLPLECLSA